MHGPTVAYVSITDTGYKQMLHSISPKVSMSMSMIPR